MKIFIYIVFFIMFLIISVFLFAVLLRSIGFLISAFRFLKSKFTVDKINFETSDAETFECEKIKEMESI